MTGFGSSIEADVMELGSYLIGRLKMTHLFTQCRPRENYAVPVLENEERGGRESHFAVMLDFREGAA